MQPLRVLQVIFTTVSCVAAATIEKRSRVNPDVATHMHQSRSFLKDLPIPPVPAESKRRYLSQETGERNTGQTHSPPATRFPAYWDANAEVNPEQKPGHEGDQPYTGSIDDPALETGAALQSHVEKRRVWGRFRRTDPKRCYYKVTEEHVERCLRHVHHARRVRKYRRRWRRSNGKQHRRPRHGKHRYHLKPDRHHPQSRPHHDRQPRPKRKSRHHKHRVQDFPYRWNDHWSCWTFPKYQDMVWPPVPWAAPPCIDLSDD